MTSRRIAAVTDAAMVGPGGRRIVARRRAEELAEVRRASTHARLFGAATEAPAQTASATVPDATAPDPAEVEAGRPEHAGHLARVRAVLARAGRWLAAIITTIAVTTKGFIMSIIETVRETVHPTPPTPPAIIDLEGGQLADALTGRALTEDEQVGTLTVEATGRLPRNEDEARAQEFQALVRSRMPEPAPTKTLLGISPELVALRERAADIIGRFPAMAGHLGNVAKMRVEYALVVPMILGIDPPEVRSVRDGLDLVECMSFTGSALPWSTRFESTLDPDAAPGTCASAPWSFLTEEQLGRARRAYAEFLEVRALGHRRVVPVPHGEVGCVMCGVGQVEVDRHRVATAWQRVSWSASALGATRSRSEQTITGYVCPACARAAQDVGAVGPTALETALARSRAHRPNFEDDAPMMLDGLKGWAVADVDHTVPNAQPWDHVTNLGDLVPALRARRWPEGTGEQAGVVESLFSEVDDLRAEVARLKAAPVETEEG
jgi:hypothetical protein